MPANHPGGQAPPRLSDEKPDVGHLEEFRTAPIDLFWRVRNECGEVGEINLAGTHITLLYGPEAQEKFFRAPDEQLDQGAAYPFMKPIFGPGVVFDLPVEQRKKAIRTRALRDEYMRRHADVINAETEAMCERLQGSGDFDLLEFFGELTTYTSTATLIGQEFRDDLAQKGSEFATAFQDLERGTDAYAYVDPYMDIPSFHARDAARIKLVELITEILDKREEEGRRCRDLLQAMDSLIDENGDKRYSRSEITGMIIGMMLAGHHTSQGAASLGPHRAAAKPGGHGARRRGARRHLRRWASGELPVAARDPAAGGSSQGDAAHAPTAHHPDAKGHARLPLQELHGQGRQTWWPFRRLSPIGTRTIFPDPDRFDPERYSDDRREDARNPWSWISFGGGRHKCIGSAFALMQMKGIFSTVAAGASSSSSASPRRATSMTIRRWSCT